MNAEQQQVLDEDIFAAEITDFSKIGVNLVNVSTQCDETSFELSKTLVNDASIFVRWRSASFEGQHNGTEHSANVPLKLITSTPRIANSIDPNNNTNGRPSENERSKSDEIITTHQFHKVTCSGCEHTHWCPRTHQMVNLEVCEKSYEKPDTASSKSLVSLKRDTNDFDDSQRVRLVPDGVSSVIEPSGDERFQSDLSENVPKQGHGKTSANEKSIHETCNTRIGGVSDIGVGDQEVPQHFGSYGSSTYEENETSNLPRHESTPREANKIPETSPDNPLTSRNGEPDDTVATKRSDCGCKGIFVHLPPNGSAETGTTKTPSHQENIRQSSNMFTSISNIAPSPTKSYDTPDTASSKSLDSRKRNTNDLANSQRKRVRPGSEDGVSSVIEPEKENETNIPSIHERTVIKTNEERLAEDTSAETRKTVKNGRNVRLNGKPLIRFRADRQSGPLTDICNVIQGKENLSNTQTGEKSVAIDAILQPKKARGKINKRKKKPVTKQRR